MVIGENGIFGKANEAKEKTNIANIKEQIQMEIASKQALNEGNITDGELKIILEEYGTINYEEDGSTIKGITTKEENYEIAIEEIYKGKTQTEVKKLAIQAITAENYGNEVSYSANGIDSWKIFLNDGINIYIIASNYVPRNGMDLEEGVVIAGEGDYCVKGNSRDELVSWIQNPAKWNKYAEAIGGATATGGPTLAQFVNSYNEKMKKEYSEDVEQEAGFISNITDTLYNPNIGVMLEGSYGYWLASACTRGDNWLWFSDCTGAQVGTRGYMDPYCSIRPLVCLPSNIYTKKENGKWTFIK